MKMAGNHSGSTEALRRSFSMADNTVLWNGISISYFCGQEKKSMPNGNIFYFCNVLEDSVSYGVSVERNRQFLATEHTDRYVRYRRTLFGYSAVAWRLAMPFLPEEREGCAVFILCILRIKTMKIRGLSFSWSRFLGIAGLKNKVARATGVPTTHGGMERKIGRLILDALFGKRK